MSRKKRSPLIVAGIYQTNFDGLTVPYTVKRSAVARYVRLEIKLDTGLTVVIPKAYKIEHIPALLNTKKRWILNRLAKYSQSPGVSRERQIKDGGTLPYLGQNLEVAIHRNHVSKDCIIIEGNTLNIHLGTDHDKLNQFVIQWYKQQAADIIKEKADKLCKRFGLSYHRLSIRSQRTRWGSCSYNGNLNFNWKLIMGPEPVVDYVVIHELMHLEEMNHTGKFWKLVAELCPRWREHKKWLREHEANISNTLYEA